MKPETAAGCLLWLAEREEDCPDLNVGPTDKPCQFCEFHLKHSAMCERCHGTGRVAQFPTLRRICTGPHMVGEELIKGYPQITTYACNEVGCPGWVVAEVHLEDLLDMAAGIDSPTVRDVLDAVEDSIFEDGTGPQEYRLAALRALVAVKAQEVAG